MTGFGEAHSQQDGLSVAVEVRAVNNRYFKLNVRTGEGYAPLEPRIEVAVRKSVRRGTVQVTVRVDRPRLPENYLINANVLERYREQLNAIQHRWGISDEIGIDALILLPGVVEDQSNASPDIETDWAVIESTLCLALESFSEMRRVEGQAMTADLQANALAAAKSLQGIQQRAPLVAEGYRERLEERIKASLEKYDIVIDAADIVREVGLFAERCDVSEEIVRLQSHLEQFETELEAPVSSGRKIEFLTQEMLRETNTIGSKANDVEIAQQVIEIKSSLERIREVIQNIE